MLVHFFAIDYQLGTINQFLAMKIAQTSKSKSKSTFQHNLSQSETRAKKLIRNRERNIQQNDRSASSISNRMVLGMTSDHRLASSYYYSFISPIYAEEAQQESFQRRWCSLISIWNWKTRFARGYHWISSVVNPRLYYVYKQGSQMVPVLGSIIWWAVSNRPEKIHLTTTIRDSNLTIFTFSKIHFSPLSPYLQKHG